MKEGLPLYWSTIVISFFLAFVHIIAGRLHFLDTIPRSRFLSAAGGISVAYVFVHVLPELGEHQQVVNENIRFLDFLEHHVYIVALLGLMVFYAIEKYVKVSRKKSREQTGEENLEMEVFWVHVLLFFFYNALIGYLLAYRAGEGFNSLILYAVTMSLHFLIIDYGLRYHHEDTYDKYGRWTLAFAVIVGAVAGNFALIPESIFAVVFAFLSGAIILNVLKEELPEERDSNLGTFAAGAGGYILLLLFIT